jgi:excinuclease ABC subunit A
MRDTITVKGARENNLKNVDVEIPREKLVVLTGLSGSGKSSLAFETIYAEGQRRFLESLSAFSRKFVTQLKKPDVDFIYGLSPVISIEQKSVSQNPRSTVGTMTDIFDYFRVLFTTSGTPRCLRCERDVPVRTPVQIAEHILTLPQNTVVEIDAPIFKIYGEDYPYLLGEIRGKGYRRLRVDDDLVDISGELELDEARDYALEVVVDTVVVKPEIFKNLVVSLENGLRVGEGFLRVRVLTPEGVDDLDAFYADFGCPEHHVTMGEVEPFFFSFNVASSACPTCLGLGVYLRVHPDLLIPDPTRSIRGEAFVPQVLKWDKNNWTTRLMYSLARHYGFALDIPWQDLPPSVVDIILYGTRGERFPIVLPEGATKGEEHVGKLFRYDGVINEIERRYRHYRRNMVAHTWMEEYIKKLMVEHICPDCLGTRLKRQRLLVTVGGKHIIELGNLTLAELRDFLAGMPPLKRNRGAGEQILREIIVRLDLLLDIGLDYMSLNRKAETLSGGESQRIRLSVQIGSQLMGMLYVLDEPSIGLHPRDNEKMISTLNRLRDIGNTVIVIEHDEMTMRAADHLIEIGPGPGVYGGWVVAQGTFADLLHNPASLTGQFLSGTRRIPMPATRRSTAGPALVVRGARQNNLRNIDVTIPLGVLVCVTGVSGSGKSTLVNDILYKKLYALFHDSRVLAGAHERLEGAGYLHDVINIDQTAIGRMPTSTPATYIGIYDAIRRLFARAPLSLERGYTAARFSFNVKGGRCEECAGYGLRTTSLQFMPDVEVICETCKGARYNKETLEVTYRGMNISEVLDLSLEDAAAFFKDVPLIAHKLGVLVDLGMGYLRLGQSSTTLSGGEAQRVKLAHELGKIKRGGHNLYILDEPTTGLHLADIQRLLDALNRLVDVGHTVLVIEHHLDLIKCADWVIDLGPEGGYHGGTIVAEGTPEEVARDERSYTGGYLRGVLDADVATMALVE